MKRSMCEIAQAIDLLSEEKIKQVLSQKAEKGIVVSYIYILHDKDTYTEEDEKKNPEHKAGTLKFKHWHIFIKFKGSREFSEIANWFDISESYVNKINANKFEYATLYAIHANKPEKYQYKVEEATANFDYASIVEAYKKRAKREKNQDKLYQRKMEIVNLIEQGVIREYNLSQYITAEEEVLFNSAIDTAFKRRIRDLGNQTERNLQCIYINGKAGTGKTTYAKMICENLGYSYIVAGSENDPFQNYGGQDCIIFDDISFDTFHWKDLLKISDNHTASLAKARYRNKALQCKLLIITTTREPREMADNMVGSSGEEKAQFYRRYKTYYKMTYDNIKVYKFNDNKDVMRYEYKKTRKNLVPEYIEKLKAQNPEVDIEDDPLKIFNGFFEKKKMIILDTTKYEDDPNVNKPLKEEIKKYENGQVDLLDLLCGKEDEDFFS